MRTAALDALNTTIVKPAEELRAMYEQVNGLRQMKPPRADSDSDSEESDVEGDNLSHGAEGTSHR